MSCLTKSTRFVYTTFLTFLLISCLKLLHFLLILDLDLLQGRVRPAYYFTNQEVYKNMPVNIAYNEDWTTARDSKKAEHHYRLEAHVGAYCRERYGENVTQNEFDTLPDVTLSSMVVDKRRDYLYTAVIGAAGAKWSKVMVEMNKVDGVRNKNLVKMSEFITQGNIYKELFKFYFVRNPLDRVISGYFYYFAKLSSAEKYLEGEALRELVSINNLDATAVSNITFEQYLNWVIHSPSSSRHFGLQSHIIQPCYIDYTLHGMFEILLIDRLFVANHVLDLRTPRDTFTTVRNLTTLTEEARALVVQVNPATMSAFYDKYEVDYRMWNYSTTQDWWYPYSGVIKGLRRPNPNLVGNDFPKVRDLISGTDQPSGGN